MRSFLHISPDEAPPRGGGGPDVDDDVTYRKVRTHGFLALGFGFALGFTFMILFGLFRLFGAPVGLENFINDLNNVWQSFLYGFISGTCFAIIYNLLIFRRLKFFGLDRSMD